MSGVDVTALAAPERVNDALRRARTLETLEGAYAAWAELKLELAAARVRFADERRRLEEQGRFLLNSLKAAGEVPGEPAADATALVQGDALADYVRTAESELRGRTDALEAARVQMEDTFAQAERELKAELAARVERFVGKVRPRLRLLVRPLGAGKRILHLERLDDDAAAILTHLLSGTLPTRYGFLRDDSTEDVALAPPPLYAEEGVAAEAVRPTASELAARFETPGGFVPVKGFVPARLPRPDGQAAFYRLLMRGPVLEVERIDGEGFSPVLTQDEAERLAGHLVRLKLAGKIELEIEAG